MDKTRTKLQKRYIRISCFVCIASSATRISFLLGDKNSNEIMIEIATNNKYFGTFWNFKLENKLHHFYHNWEA